MSGLQFVGLFGGGGGEQKTCYIEAITSSGTWTVPEGVTRVDLCLVPGGSGSAGGYGSLPNQVPGNQQGWGGKPVTIKGIPVIPLSTHTCTIGTGGTGGDTIASAGYGGNTVFDEHVALGTELIGAAVSIFPDEFEGLLVSGKGVVNVAVIPPAGAGIGVSNISGMTAASPEPNTGSGGGVYGGNGYGTKGASGLIYIRYYK